MKKVFPILVIAIFITSLAYSAEFSIGFRFNHFQLTGDGEFWNDYVSGKKFDYYRYNGSEWEHVSPPLLISSAQSDDFSNFNYFPALRATLKFDKWSLILADVEYFRAKDIRIVDFVFSPVKKKSQYVYDYEENSELTILSIKHSADYIIEKEKGTFYFGGGLGWYIWDFKSNMRYIKYARSGNEYYPDKQENYEFDDGKLAIGIHVEGGYEAKLTDLLYPFVELSYQYVVSTWAPDNLTGDFYYDMPNSPPNPDKPKTDDKYGKLNKPIKDSYKISLSGLKVSFGVNFKF